jgi:hypothetical protein
MSVAPRAGPAPLPWPKSRSGASCQRCWYGNVTGTQHPDHRGKYVSPWATRTWPVSVPTRALALRGAEILVIPAGLNQTTAVGRLGGLCYRHAQSRIWHLWS